MIADTSNTAEPLSGSNPIWVFTPSRTAPADLEFILVQRHKLLQDAVERVRESALTDHKHHLLFVGPRGCGKTHLVTLIVSRLSQDKELEERLRIAWLNEDETCTTLLELLVKIHCSLQKRYPEEYREETLAAAYDQEPSAALDYVTSQTLTSLGSRTLLVVAENLDTLFEGLGDFGQKQLRALLQEHPKFSVVATAQRLVEDLSTRASPFFGFFQTEHLKPLNVAEATELLQNIARLRQNNSVVEFLATGRGRSRVRALHHLSGGNHRIYIVLSQFITRDSIEALLGPFMKMVDELTPYYQERLRWLPAQQRKIVECLCASEYTLPVREIAKKLFTTSQTISSQLQGLREKGYVEANQRGRESLYEVSEPLMRLCVEVKENQDHQPLRLLVDFLRVWYDDFELKHRLGGLASGTAERAYLESAIQKNNMNGNLRRQILMEDIELSLCNERNPLDPTTVRNELKDLPEAALVVLKNLSEGNKSEAIECLNESIWEESTPSAKASLLSLRAQFHCVNKDLKQSIKDLTSVIGLADAPVEQVAMALVHRGITLGQTGETQREIEDYTAVISLTGAPVEQVATALFNRGIAFGQTGETQRAIEDYTAVISLTGAPVEQVAMALVNRGFTFGQTGETRREIEDYTAVIGLTGAPVEQVATALFNRGIAFGQTGETQRAIEDYTAVIGLNGAPVEQVAMALFNRGIAFGQTGETQRAIEDYTAVISLTDAPVEQVAMALVSRGTTFGQTGDNQRAIEDYTAVISLTGAPVEQVATALVSRGITFGQTGDNQRAIEDYTTTIDLPHAPIVIVATALLARGITFGKRREMGREIEDYTTVIGLSGVLPEQIERALLCRGVRFNQANRIEEARMDFESAIRLPTAPAKQVIVACGNLAELLFHQGRWNEGFQALESGLERGSKEQPPYYGTTAHILGTVFSAGLSTEGRMEKVNLALSIHNKYQALTALGQSLVEHIGGVFRKGEPFPSADNLEGWAVAWEQAAMKVDGFQLPIRLLRTGVEFVKAGGKDSGILLSLTSTERTILEQALGLAEKEPAEST